MKQNISGAQFAAPLKEHRFLTFLSLFGMYVTSLKKKCLKKIHIFLQKKVLI